MKIGIDVDGVILDYQRMLLTYGELYDFIELKNKGIVKRDEARLVDRYNWNSKQRQNFIDKYFIKLSKMTPLVPGAKEVISMLKNDGNELVVISARGGNLEKMQDVALEKFEEEEIYFDKYYWKQDDKLEIAQKEKIDIMIDDNYKVCKTLSENKIKTIYFRERGMKKLEENEYLKEISNWGEIYRYFTTISLSIKNQS